MPDLGGVDDLEYLGAIDPDDPRPSSQQIANQLRAAILTRKLQPGDKLPSQHGLATRYGVARETVKVALRMLVRERLVVSRQGSGAYVRARAERPVGLRSHLEAAFQRPHVSIDFAGFSGETLHNTLSDVFDKVRTGRLTPTSLSLRLMLSDMSAPITLPCRADTGADDPLVRERAARIGQHAVAGLTDVVRELTDLGLVKAGAVDVRMYGVPPVFKLYLVNDTDAFFGFYPVVEHEVQIKGESVPIYDPMGKDAALFHYSASDEPSTGSEYVEQARQWFDSLWNTVARPYELV